MQDLLFISIFFPLMLLSLIQPWSGLLSYGWIVFLEPESQLFSFAAEVPFSLIIAFTTALGWAFAKEKKSFEVDLTTMLFVALMIVTALSTANSLMLSTSEEAFQNLLKITALLFLLRVMLTSRVRLHSYIWLLVFAMILLGLKESLLFVLAAGADQVADPEQLEIGDRYHLAVAMLFAVPMLNYLRLQSRYRWVQICLFATKFAIVAAVILTGSLVGFLSLLVMTTCLLWTSKRLIPSLLMLVILAVGLHSLTPTLWKERFGMSHQVEVQAKNHQLLAWQTYLTAALDRPLTGAGPKALQHPPVFERYAPALDEVNVQYLSLLGAQSGLFQILGDLGFIGLVIYVALLAAGFFNARWINQQAHGRPDLDWLGDLGRMVQISLIVFCISGAALAIPFNDLFLSLLVMLSATRCMAKEKTAEQRPSPAQRRSKSAVPVDMSAIAAIWQGAADTKTSGLHRRHSDRRVASNSASAK